MERSELIPMGCWSKRLAHFATPSRRFTFLHPPAGRLAVSPSQFNLSTNIRLWLQHVQDHTIFPSSEMRARSSSQWMKVSKLEEFVKACKAFAVDHQGPKPYTLVQLARGSYHQRWQVVLVCQILCGPNKCGSWCLLFLAPTHAHSQTKKDESNEIVWHAILFWHWLYADSIEASRGDMPFIRARQCMCYLD